MTDYSGILLIEEDDLVGATLALAESLILEEDADIFVESYTPSEGCP